MGGGARQLNEYLLYLETLPHPPGRMLWGLEDVQVLERETRKTEVPWKGSHYHPHSGDHGPDPRYSFSLPSTPAASSGVTAPGQRYSLGGSFVTVQSADEEWVTVKWHETGGESTVSRANWERTEKEEQPIYTSPLDEQLVWSDHNLVDQQMKALFDGRYGNFIVDDTLVSPELDNAGMGRIVVSGKVKDKQGVSVGMWRRILERDEETPEGWVENDLLDLNLTSQGQGFATKFNDSHFDQYRKWGLNRVELFAGSTAGGYVWAIKGFQFKHPEDRVGSMKLLRDTVESDDVVGPDLMYELEQLELKGDKITPRDIALFGVNQPIEGRRGKKSWLGKEVMLQRHWDGVLEL